MMRATAKADRSRGCRGVTSARIAATLGLVALAGACSITPTLRQGINPFDSAPATSSPSPALEADSRVQTGVLENGLVYFLEPHLLASKRVHLVLVVRTGVLSAEKGQLGVAHFVEHMAFRGTKRFPKQSIIDFLERSGLTFGADFNAHTMPDRTVYELNVPSDDPELIDTALDVLADWAGAVTFDSEEVERERGVVLAEWLRGQGAARRLSDHVQPLLLVGSQIVPSSALGEKAAIEAADRNPLLGFYRRWYRPQYMAVIAVGDIDSRAFAVAIEKHFGSLAALPDTAASPKSRIMLRHEPVVAVIADAEAPGSLVDLSFRLPSPPIRTEDEYRAHLLSRLACIALNDRLGTLSSSAKTPWATASASLGSEFFGLLDVVHVTASPKKQNARASIEALLVEVERAKRFGFSANEIERAEQEWVRLLDHRASAEATEGGGARAMALANGYGSGNVLVAAEREKQLAAKLARAISQAEVGRTAARTFATGSEMVIVTGVAGDSLPSKDAILSDISRIEKQSVGRYNAQDDPQRELMSSTPTPGRIVSETRIPEIDVTVWTLANGAQVVLKHTDFRNDEILEQSVGFGGTNRLAARTWSSGQASPEIVRVSGVGGLDGSALSRLLSGRVVSAYPWVSEQDHGIRASASPVDVETMFQLLYSYTTAPRRDEKAFEAYRASSRERIRHQELLPDMRFHDAISMGLWGNEPRRSRPNSDSVEAQNLDDALMFYRKLFANVSGTVFVIVGAFDEHVLRPLAERYLASLPGEGVGDTYHDLGLHERKGIISVRTAAGTEDRAMVNLTYHGETRWSEDAHTDLNSLRDYLDIRLREVLRVQMGGVYSAKVAYDFERIPFDSYHLTIAFPCKPSQAGELIRVAQDVIERTKVAGVEPGYIEKLTNMRTHRLQQAYGTNSFWLERLVEKFEMKEDPRDILALDQLTSRVTSDNIKEAARRFLRSDQYLDARLLPAAASSPSRPTPARSVSHTSAR